VPGQPSRLPVPRARRSVAVALALLGAAAYFVLRVLHNPEPPAYDTYAYFLPNAIHAARGLRDGGKGLWWNPYNAAGGPFFANGVVGFLYPLHLLFLVLEPSVALHVILIVSMLVGGLGAFALGQEWGLGLPAALGAALAFELGHPMSEFVGWSPMITGPLVWVPWVLLAFERLLAAPSRRRCALLAILLAVQLLPGNVLVNALTYQVIALRLAWEMLFGGAGRPWRALWPVTAALVLAPLVVAVQMLPNVEFARWSIRMAIPVASRLQAAQLPLAQYVAPITRRRPPVPFLVVPIVLAALAPLPPARRRLAGFLLTTALLYATLALGSVTPLFRWYVHLPPGGTVLNIPHRLFWVCGIALCLLTGLGLQALADARELPAGRWSASALVLALSVVIGSLAPGGLRRSEGAALALLAVAGVAGGAGRRRAAVWIGVAALTLNLSTVSIRWVGSLTSGLAMYRTHEPALDSLRALMTPQERFFLAPSLQAELGATLMRRTSTVFAFQNFSDYEVLPERRYVEYLLMLGRGRPLEHYTDLFAAGLEWFTAGVRRRLLDLAAVRYVVTTADGEPIARRAKLPAVPVADAGLRVYENDAALPRARWVPRIEVVADPGALLARLAYGSDDLRAVTLVEKPPPSGFVGIAAASPAGRATFVTDDPEHIVIDVDAPARGFLVLADHYYPGWWATVNGRTVAIQRANYMFRTVEVPAGESRVEFRFFPTRFWFGAAVTTVALVVLVVLASSTERG